MHPSYSDIVYFMEVAQTLNVSRAAERLGISQPSLSTSIKRLEDVLSTDLLVRTKSGVRLTKSGNLFLLKSKELIERWEEIKINVSNSTEEVSGIYKLGCHSSVALYTMPKMLPEILKESPKLELQLIHALSRVICEQVISFELDLAIVVNPIPHPDLIIKELYKDTVHFWASPQMKKAEELTLIVDPYMLQAQDILQKAKKKSLNFSRTITTTNLELITQLTHQGIGVGIIPNRVVDGQCNAKLKIFDDSLPFYTDRVCLIYRADLPKTMAIKTLVESIQRLA